MSFFFNWKSAYYEFILIQPSGMPLEESVFQLVDEGVVNVPNELTLSNQFLVQDDADISVARQVILDKLLQPENI